MSNQLNNPYFISITDASHQLGCRSTHLLRAAIKKGHLKAYQFSDRGKIFLYLPDWETWKENRVITPPPADKTMQRKRSRRSTVEALKW